MELVYRSSRASIHLNGNGNGHSHGNGNGNGVANGNGHNGHNADRKTSIKNGQQHLKLAEEVRYNNINIG